MFRILIACHKTWIGNFVIGGLNVHSVLYTIWTFTCFEVGQEGKYITNLILKDFNETKYLVKNLLQSCMWKLKPKLPPLFDQVDVVFVFFSFGWLVIYVAYDNLFKYSNIAAQFFYSGGSLV